MVAIALLYIIAAWWPFQFELPLTLPNGAVIDTRGVVFESQGLISTDAHPLIRAIRSKPGMVLQVKLRIRTRPLHAAMLVAACTSLTMELGQIAFADRLPALPDLILNLGGGLLGALLFSRKQPAYRD